MAKNIYKFKRRNDFVATSHMHDEGTGE